MLSMKLEKPPSIRDILCRLAGFVLYFSSINDIISYQLTMIFMQEAEAHRNGQRPEILFVHQTHPVANCILEFQNKYVHLNNQQRLAVKDPIDPFARYAHCI
jgi:hypothetical protein